MPCSEANLRAVWEAFDRTRGEVVRVNRKALTQVVACHRVNHENEPADLVHHQPRANAANIECNRAPLFAILRSHTCGEPPRLRSSQEDRKTKLAN